MNDHTNQLLSEKESALIKAEHLLSRCMKHLDESEAFYECVRGECMIKLSLENLPVRIVEAKLAIAHIDDGTDMHRAWRHLLRARGVVRRARVKKEAAYFARKAADRWV